MRQSYNPIATVLINMRHVANNAISLHKSTCDNAKITPIEYRLLNNRQSLNPLIPKVILAVNMTVKM